MKTEKVIILSRSVFPQAVDTFDEMYDLPASLVAKAKRLQELKMQPSLSSIQQEEVEGLVVELKQYMLTPETFNKFQDSLVGMQQFMLTEIGDYITDKQGEWSAMITNFSLKGEYDSSVQYYFQNMVTYRGSLYICKADAKGKIPTDNSYWEKISEKGEKGDVGLGVTYKGEYNNTSTYALGDAISYNGGLYYAKKSSTGNLPTNTSFWHCVDKFFTSEEQPENVQTGNVWIKVISSK